jgi:GT2 family glycosyltransferase/glycosyltransferase involved in cell wall biosynthesis
VDVSAVEMAQNLALIGESGYFDEAYYQTQRTDLVRVPDLKRHYLEVGWREDLDPSALFGTSAYLSAYHDVRASGMNPLVHFVRHGMSEGREALPPGSDVPVGELAVAVAPSEADWAALPRARAATSPVVDVVIPAYRGFAETMRCIYSVLASAVRAEFELWVIDDASPEPALSEALDDLAADGRIRLFRNAANLGFVRTCNFAMQLHPTRDVVLLNSDTEVFGDWLDRLRAAASLPNVGTVTPFSNNAEICSYPVFLRDNARRLETSDAELDAVLARVNRGEVVELPTAVGFCMYVRRECLNTVGVFDESRFGRGYGEENDFSRRALCAGWRSVLAADVFVRHYGGVSFGPSKWERVQAAVRAVADVHPDYDDAVAAFIEADPIAPYRRRVDAARVRRATPGPTFLFVTHNRGGGTERHVVQMAERITADGGHVIFARADGGSGDELRFEYRSLLVPNLGTIDVTRDIGDFVSIAGELGVNHLHVHHLADFPAVAAEFFRVAAERLGIRYDVTIHDYFVICPRITLIDASGFYCGEPDESDCTRCASRDGSEFGTAPIWVWRDRYERFLRGARRVFVPDDDARRRMQRYFPALKLTIRPHPENPGVAQRPREDNDRWSRNPENVWTRRRVGVIGAIGPHKGSRVLLACASIARERGLPLEFVVIGTTDINAELAQAGVSITGTYAEDELQNLIANARLDLAWFPSVWPETYSYTLSAALDARLFPVAFDLGAIATRLRALGWGHLMPIEHFFQPERVANELATVVTSLFPVPANGKAAGAARTSFVADYYELSPDALKATTPVAF